MGAAHSRAEKRVQDFLDAAYELIDERGTADFTIQEVLDRCNQSMHGFYQVFSGKDELLLALFEDSVGESVGDLLHVVEQESDPLARLRAFTIRLYEWCEPVDAARATGRHKYRPIAEFAVQLSTAHFAQAEAAMEPVSRLLLQLIDDAVAAGVARLRDPQRAAVILKQLVMYSWFRNRTIEDPRMRITAEEIWEFCLHGIGAEVET